MTIGAYILTSVFFISTMILGYIVFNLDRKNKLLLSFIEGRESDYNVVEFLGKVMTMLTKTYSQLKRIDKRGTFESDDEVGFVFRGILKIIEDIVEKINIVYDEVKELEGKINVELTIKETVSNPNPKEKKEKK